MFKYQLRKDDKLVTVSHKEGYQWNCKKEMGSTILENFDLDYQKLGDLYIELIDLKYSPAERPGQILRKNRLRRSWVYCKRENGLIIEESNYGGIFYMKPGNSNPFQLPHYHREDGPAIYNVYGQKQYWIDGRRLTEEAFNQRYGQTK